MTSVRIGTAAWRAWDTAAYVQKRVSVGSLAAVLSLGTLDRGRGQHRIVYSDVRIGSRQVLTGSSDM